ncbi:ABC transporter permease [Clostridium aminobutyricum]|uniref:ABC transporter permease n=1 Tax=Clostridium aminobutyricum TaxID=33953 RepID=A0A939D9H8_CLOAM|nr:ABC transporter permease [Clostridium aminobutyricum]MBN7773542.1 ABC transporter permease [Clostridium aminobutyricum]
MKTLKNMIYSKTLSGAFIVLIFWYVLHLTIGSKIIPGPYETIVTFFRLMTGTLLLHMLVSLFRITAAMVISMGIGVPLGLWMGLSERADSVLTPVAYILYPIPKVAFLPIFMVIFGLGNSSKIILIISIVVFQILLAVRDGVKEIPTELHDSVRSLGLSRWQTYTNLVFPAVLPKIISALRVSIGVCIATLFFSENFATTYGIGYFIMNCWVMVDYVQMFAGILAMSLMGILIFKVIDFMERKICPWI